MDKDDSLLWISSGSLNKTILVHSSFAGLLLRMSLAQDDDDNIKSVALLSTNGRWADAHKLSFDASLIGSQMNITDCDDDATNSPVSIVIPLDTSLIRHDMSCPL